MNTTKNDEPDQPDAILPSRANRINLRCRKCNVILAIDESARGRVVKCGACGTLLRVPAERMA